MPAIKVSLGVAAACAVIAAMGCATKPYQATRTDAGTFHESSSDVANRAPPSMSLPDQKTNPNAPTIDAQTLREQADYHFALAEAYALESSVSRSIDEYKLSLIYDQKSPSIRLRLAAAFVKQGLVTEAMEQAKLAIETDPKSIEAYLLLGGLESALRLYPEALEAYRKARDLDPDANEAPMFIGALLAEQKKYPESIQTFEALTRNPKNPSPHLAWYYLGRVRLEQDVDKGRKAAERDFLAAIKSKPGFVDAVSALGALLEATGRAAEAQRLYRDFQAKYGPDAGIAESLAHAYLENQKFDLALEQLEIIEASDPDNLNARMKIAFVLIEQKKYPDAIVKLEDILAKAPDSDKIRFYLGAVYEETKDYGNAISSFEKVPVASAYYAESVVHASYLYKLTGDPGKAMSTVESGIKNKEDYPQFYSLYASYLDDAKMYAKAVDVLGRATKRFPDDAQLRFFLGSMQDRVGDFDGMVASMRKVLELDANHVQALNYLAYTYAEKNARLDEAEKLVRKAIQLQPQDGYIMDTLGWVLFKRGNFTEAIKVLETAYKLAPNEAVIAEHLGDAYYKSQLPDKAKKMYLKASEFDANPENVRKIRAKMLALDRQAAPAPELGQSPAPDRAAASVAP